MTQTRADSTFETILDHVLPFAGSALIPDQGPLRNAAGQLPPIPNGMFEIRLEAGNSQVDLLTGFQAGQFPLFAKWQRQSRSSGSTHLAQIAKALTTEDSYLRQTTSGFGLEYDLITGAGTELPMPAVFCIPNKGYVSDHAKLYEYVEALLPAVLNTIADKVLLFNASKLLGNLGTDSVVHTLGIMLSRQRQALRLQIQEIHPEQLRAIFEATGVAATPPRLDTLLELAQSVALPYLTCLDLAPQLQPVVGLEFNDINTRPSQVLEEVLDLLVERQLCCERKSLAIANWIGSSAPPKLPFEWGVEPAFANLSQCRRFFVQIKRQVSHIKIMLDGNGSITAKIYLEFYPQAARLE